MNALVRVVVPACAWVFALGCGLGGASSGSVPASDLGDAERHLGDTSIQSTLAAMEDAPPETANVLVMPHDVSTAARGGGARVAVLDDREALTADEQAQWSERLHLVEWPSMTPVESTTTYVVPLATRGDHGHSFEVRPTARLLPRWYAVAVDLSEVPDRHPQPGLHSTGESSWFARFRPDSHPIAVEVRLESEGANTSVEVTFSERVGVGDEPVYLRVGDVRVPCTLLTSFVDPTDGSRFEAQAAVAWRCATEAPTDILELTLPDDVQTVGGVSAVGPDDRSPVRLSWDPARMTGDRIRLLDLRPDAALE